MKYLSDQSTEKMLATQIGGPKPALPIHDCVALDKELHLKRKKQNL